jgi:hypothetical protein
MPPGAPAPDCSLRSERGGGVCRPPREVGISSVFATVPHHHHLFHLLPRLQLLHLINPLDLLYLLHHPCLLLHLLFRCYLLSIIFNAPCMVPPLSDDNTDVPWNDAPWGVMIELDGIDMADM